MTNDEVETERLKEVYRWREDQDFFSKYSYKNPGFVYLILSRERDFLKALKHSHFDLKGKHALEVGCGTGHILPRFLEWGCSKASGIDLVEERIQTGRKMYPQLELKHGDASRLPYSNNTFDLVYHVMCLSSVLDSSRRLQIASEMMRVTKPGGIVLHYDMLPKPLSSFRRPNHLHKISDRELQSLFQAKPKIRRRVGLLTSLTDICGWNWLAAEGLSLVPIFRTHRLAVFQKT